MHYCDSSTLYALLLVADNTYTVSGARDHYKQQGQAGFVLEQVPEHANFFSDLKHYPKSTFRCETLSWWQLHSLLLCHATLPCEADADKADVLAS